MTSDAAPSLYARVGGQAFFDRLVDAFYDGVRADPVLLALYPEPADLAPARRRLAMFLAQYWGGPTSYSDERGHPRLRMRHAPYPIDEHMRDRWLGHMRRAMDACVADATVRAELEGYFAPAADHLRNA